jgi:hypothetical protein
MKGHTDGTSSMGKGSIYSTFYETEDGNRSSTESEVVGVYDVLTQILWTANFIRSRVAQLIHQFYIKTTKAQCY